MSDVIDVQIFDNHGQKLWSGDESESVVFLRSIAGGNSAVAAMAESEIVPRCSKNEVMRTAEELALVSRRGAPKGFLTTLPSGKLFEACVDAFNVPHLAALDVNRIDFPLIFDSSGAAMTELIEPYHLQGRTFALAGREELRLSYAADPNLFAWLQNQTLANERLPYAVYSPQPVFRNFQTGELSIQRTRQFTVPDIHILTSPDNAPHRYLHALTLAAESTRFWFGDDYIHVLDSVVETANDNDEFYSQASKAVGGITVVRRMSKRAKYYAQKTGVLVWSGYDNVMLYNLQMDDLNPRRFNIRLDDGNHAVVIHACIAMGMSRMLPLMIGRGLCGISAKSLPVELAVTQVILVPMRNEHEPRACEIADRLLGKNIRVLVDSDYGKSIGSRLGRIQKAWQPFYTVIGDREFEQPPVIQSADRSASPMTIEEFLTVYSDRIRKCTPSVINRAKQLPFVRGI